MKLKQKATGGSKKGLAQKATTTPNNVSTPMNDMDPVAPEQGMSPMFDAPPPLLPPTYQYVEIFARIPGLRKKAGMGPV